MTPRNEEQPVHVIVDYSAKPGTMIVSPDVFYRLKLLGEQEIWRNFIQSCITESRHP